jgi:superfamily II DNA or RNA helicase
MERSLFHDPRPVPRDYQRVFRDAAVRTLASTGICGAEQATGTGKTLLAAMVSDHYERTLVIDPRIVLCDQIAGGIKAWRLLAPEVEQGNRFATGDSPVTVASLQTLLSDGRGKRFKPDLVIVDEAHYAAGGPTLDLLDYYRANGAHVLGLTATPHGMGAAQYYGSWPIQYGPLPAIEHGWLVPISARRVVVKSIDTSVADGTVGDFSAEDVRRILGREMVWQEYAALIAANHQKRGAVYCPSVKVATAIRSLLADRHGIPTALIHSKMPPSERADEMQRYMTGEARLIVNVSMLTMGWDAPCEELHLMTPTKSIQRYLQIVGRALRPARGTVDGPPTQYLRRLAIRQSEKPHCRILDYCDNVRHHRVCSAIDIVLPPEKVQKYREKLLAKAEESDIEIADIEAEVREQEKLEKQRAIAEIEAEKERRREIVVGVTFDAHTVDPFAKPTATNPRRREARMLWGPYKGQPIRLIPPSELRKIFKTMRRSPGNEWLVNAIKRELARGGDRAASA